MNDESMKRIYPKLSKEESDKQWIELQEKYKKESGVNFGEIFHPRNKSYRGMLVEIIVKSFTEQHLFDEVDYLKEILQERLNLNLKFETNVSDTQSKNGQTFGNISFEDENGLVKVIHFTIISTGVIV
jgi:hypothetical protein